MIGLITVFIVEETPSPSAARLVKIMPASGNTANWCELTEHFGRLNVQLVQPSTWNAASVTSSTLTSSITHWWTPRM